MRFRPLIAVACTASLAAALTAQDTCPSQTTQHVPADVFYGPPQGCGGIDYRVAEVQITSPRGECPLFAVFIPSHDFAVPSATRTRVDVVAQQPITQLVFECRRAWFLIIPIGSTCVLVKQVNVGVVQSLVTVPCDPLPT
jgi:hypothetical protein